LKGAAVNFDAEFWKQFVDENGKCLWSFNEVFFVVKHGKCLWNFLISYVILLVKKLSVCEI
jgi:hypothetical protein